MSRVKGTALLLLLAIVAAALVHAQGQPSPVPAPLKQDSAGEALPELPPNPDEQKEWPGLSAEAAPRLADTAKRYSDYTVRFTATETARTASYDRDEADKESVRKYGYLLERIPGDDTGIREYRQVLKKNGALGKDEVNDQESFPPAYAWVFLFSEFHQPYFAYRELGDRFEGFDWVREFEFRGALPFTDGRDIRQWEGRVLVDAVTYTPVEIHAEPSRQKERIKLLFDRWQQSFNIIGFHTAPRPFGHRCEVAFRLRRDKLSFPTELRYDTFRAVSSKQTVPWKASIRNYDGYRFFQVGSDATVTDKSAK